MLKSTLHLTALAPPLLPREGTSQHAYRWIRVLIEPSTRSNLKRLFLIDGSALVFRSFHAFSGRAQLTTRGRDVGMLYGFLTTLLMILRREKPDYLAVAFDTAAPTFRKKKYEAYKANRPPLDESIREQIPILFELLTILNIPQISLDGWEADDLMGTLATRANPTEMEVFLVTGDKDFYQLVNERVKVYTLPVKGANIPIIYDAQGVREKFGVLPHQVTDVLGLMGDSSDNVPGVPKIGRKSAVALIDQFGSLENVLANASEVSKPSQQRSLEEYADQARLSLDLVIIDTDAPIDYAPDSFTFGPLNNPAARHKLMEMEFTSLLNQIDEIEPLEEFTKETTPKVRYKSIINPEQLSELLTRLNASRMVSIDVETTSVDPMQAELVGMSFSIEPEQGWYVAVNYFEGLPSDYSVPKPPKLRPNTTRELTFILEKLAPFYCNGNIPKTGQNLKYDIKVLACYGVEVENVAFDTMIASHLLDSSARQHNLDLMAEIHLGYKKIPTSNLIGKGSKQISMKEVPLHTITEYACEDTDIALRLTRLFQPRIRNEGFQKLLKTLELPLMKVLVKMECLGVRVDRDQLSTMSGAFQTEIDGIAAEIRDLAGVAFNLNSTQQLADVLYNRLGLPPGRKTKFGYSTDTGELERLAPVHPLPGKLLRYRHLSKLKSTYIDSLPTMIHPVTGRIHTSYSQTGAATGRLSSNDPNLQNIPIRSEEGGRIRKAFVAGKPGWVILSADYSQIELRIMAHLSGDERLQKAFNEKLDIHSATAAWMNDMPPELVTSDMRRQAKEVNFGVLYGMGDFGLAQRLGITRKRAKQFIQHYFSNFSRVKEYIDEIHAFARENGYVETMMGRKRPLPDINASNFNIRSNAERVATNTPIQGSAADMIKKAMIDIQNMLEDENFETGMLMQVHDELIFETPEDELEKVAARISEVMANALPLNVPIEVGIGWGESWLDAHD